MLRVQDLKVTINNTVIIQDVSAHFEKGKITAIIGPNGSGKSTMLSCLNRVNAKPNSVFLEDTDITKISKMEFARRVAVLPQMGAASGDLRVKDVVLMGRFPYKGQFRDYTDYDREIAQKVMKQVGVEHLQDRHIGVLSGGERQRVLIGKALAQEPELIILDEPTNHLDVKHKLELMELLKSWNITTVVVLHDLSLVLQYCDDVILMKDGRLFSHGPVEEQVVPATLEEVFGVPFVVFEHNGRNYVNY